MTTDANKPISIKVEGWRGISHSYSLVNQFQILHWSRSGLARLQHVDMPFIMPHWSNGENSAGFDEQDQTLIENISQDITPEAVYRIFAPFGLDTPVELPTLTFAVTEFGLSSGNYSQSAVDTYAARGGLIHTPSQWSKRRLIANGIPEGIIHVVPHAADAKYFFPMDANGILHNRRTLGFAEDDVVLLNVGTHHWNKGLDVLLKAFAQARKRNPRLKLLLKDQRSTYLMNSESFVQQTLTEIGMNDADTMAAIRMVPGPMTLAQLNCIYNLADFYLTPYRAEGFNLPALEAQACGTPVIATAGGATDDFLSHPANRLISGRLHENQKLKDDLPVNAYIEPDVDELIAVLSAAERAARPTSVGQRMDWAGVGRLLCGILRGARSGALEPLVA
ncbi:MAG: glycosyltransferase family 4 protein [Limnohabitans sp.]|nr:glycosyltransferase family 4 protein [Limnohabitans sp.]